MDGKKTYQLVINGITENIDAVESLNRQLDALDKRINALSNTSINVKTNGGGASSALSQEAALEKEINSLKNEGIKLDAKIAASKTEIYRQVQATKDVYKESVADQKQIAAQERLTADAYANTMQGMKQRLADLKTMINNTDLGDKDVIKKMTEEANELTTKLKEMEEAYGQFGRNVGNYKSAADGFTNIKVEVGAVTREFNNAREASRQLKNELNALQTAGKGNTQEAKNLRNAIYNLESAIKDATVSSKAMDEAMDFMQSFTAIGSMGKGLQAFFGLDNNEITHSIQNLVALQSVLQGIEQVRKQMETREGIGKILSSGMEGIDKWSYHLKRAAVEGKGLFGVLQKVGINARTAAAGINAMRTALKGLMSVGILIAITAAIEGLQKLVELIKNWVKGDADLLDAERLVNMEIEEQNKLLKERLSLINQREKSGFLSKEDAAIQRELAYAKALEATNQKLRERLKTYDDANITNPLNRHGNFERQISGDTGVTWFGGFDASDGLKTIDDFVKRWDYLMGRVQNGEDIIDSWTSTADDAKDELVHLSKLVGGDLWNAMNKLSAGEQRANETQEEYNNRLRESTRNIVEYISHMDELTNGKYTQALRVGIDQGFLDAQFKQAYEIYQMWKEDIEKEKIQLQITVEGRIENMLDELDPTRPLKRQLEDAKRYADEFQNTWSEEQKQKYNKYVKELEKRIKNGGKKGTAAMLKTLNDRKKIIKDAEDELIRLRIELMKEGLNKTMKQLENEKNKELDKIKDNMEKLGKLSKEEQKLFNDLQLATEQNYYKKMEDAKREHNENMLKLEHSMWMDLMDAYAEQAERYYDLNEQIGNKTRFNSDKEAEKYFPTNISSYGQQGKISFSKKTRDFMGIISTDEKDEKINDYKELINAEREYLTQKQALEAQNAKIDYVATQKRVELDKYFKLLTKEEQESEIERIENELEPLKYEASQIELLVNTAKYKYEELDKVLEERYKDHPVMKEKLIEEQWTKDLKTTFDQRMLSVNSYWRKRMAEEMSLASKAAKNEEQIEISKYNIEAKQEEESYRERLNNLMQLLQTKEEYYKGEAHLEEEQVRKEIKDKEVLQTRLEEIEEYKNAKILEAKKQYESQLNTLEQTHSANTVAMASAHTEALIAIENDRIQKQKDMNAQAFSDILQEYSNFYNAISQLEGKQPVMIGESGLINVKQTKKNARDLLNAYQALYTDLKAKRQEINKLWENGLIDREAYESTLREMDAFGNDLGEKMDDVQQQLNLGGSIQMIAQNVNAIVQMVGPAVQDIMGSISEIMSNSYEAEIEAQERFIQKYEENLQKQKYATQQYADAVSEIEGNLKEARGDARQYLLDNLNAQVAAQRASLAQEKKIEKEKERAEERKKKLEHDQAVAKKRMDLAQAVINTSMAISYAAVNKWPVPAIPMMALAAAAGAAQFAAIQSQEIPSYGQGGQLEGGIAVGNRHRDGGIKVLGGRAEIEGGEYVTNRISTSYNSEVLEFINSKKRRINLADMVEFYSKGKVAANVRSASPKTMFADGGEIPVLRSDIDINDRFVSTIEAYANRPTVVSVQEIVNVNDNLNQVKVLSGLEPSTI